jgi:hypothetical protein
MAAYEAAMAALDAQPFVLREKARLRAEARAALIEKVGALMTRARLEVLRPFEEEERALRAQARADGTAATDGEIRAQVFRHQRAVQLAAQVDRALTPNDARAVYLAAQLTMDESTIRFVAQATQARLRRLAEVDAGKDISALRNASVQSDGEFQQWEKTHPNLTQRLAELERQKGNAAIEFRASAEFALELFGLVEPPLTVVRE